MHAFMPAILLRMARLDAFDADAQAQPPHGELAQVEQGVRGGEGHAIITANVGGHAALFTKPFKHGESILFAGGGKRFTGEQKTAGMIGDGQRIAVLAISQQELPFVIGAPQFVGPLPERQGSALCTMAQATAALDQAVAVQHGVNRTLGGNFDPGKATVQTLADLASTPRGVLALHIQDVVLHLKRKLMSIPVRAPTSIRQPLHSAFLIAIENLMTRFAGNPELPAKFRHRLAGEPQTAVFRPSPNTPSKASLPPRKEEKCNLCVRYDLLPMNRVSAGAKIPIVPFEFSPPLDVVNRSPLQTEEVPKLVKGERRARTQRTAAARNEHPGDQRADRLGSQDDSEICAGGRGSAGVWPTPRAAAQARRV